jgi:hypothetical protein
MSTELIAILVTCLTCLIEIVFLGSILYRMYTKMGADDAALHLQGRKLEEVLRAMARESSRQH